MLSNNEETTPAVTKTTEMFAPSPLTVANAAKDTSLGNTSPAGSTGTEKFNDYPSSDEDAGAEQVEAATKTPAKTVLPENYDASSGNTPAGWEGTYRQANARCSTDRPFVPGHTSSPRVPPGPFFVDTPPSCK